MAGLNYSVKSFEQLTLAELYRLLQLRQEVFIVEQNCPYLDADGKDVKSYHVLGKDENGEILCCSRLLPEGVSYLDFVSIGRVVNSKQVRGSGEGIKLMEFSIREIKKLFPNKPIKIGAQAYLKTFYENLGFEDIHLPYLEDGIPHLIMIMP